MCQKYNWSPKPFKTLAACLINCNYLGRRLNMKKSDESSRFEELKNNKK